VQARCRCNTYTLRVCLLGLARWFQTTALGYDFTWAGIYGHLSVCFENGKFTFHKTFLICCNYDHRICISFSYINVTLALEWVVLTPREGLPVLHNLQRLQNHVCSQFIRRFIYVPGNSLIIAAFRKVIELWIGRNKNFRHKHKFVLCFSSLYVCLVTVARPMVLRSVHNFIKSHNSVITYWFGMTHL
jgi:hypothetical protein